MSCSSVSARPAALCSSWRSSTNSRSPMRPVLWLTEAMHERRSTASPTRSRLPACQCRRPPPLPRPGSRTAGNKPPPPPPPPRPPPPGRGGTAPGGRSPPGRGWPSGPISLCLDCGRKYSQCHSGGSTLPGTGSGSARSKVADRPRTGAAWSMSLRTSVRPCQRCRCANSVASMGRGSGLAPAAPGARLAPAPAGWEVIPTPAGRRVVPSAAGSGGWVGGWGVGWIGCHGAMIARTRRAHNHALQDRAFRFPEGPRLRRGACARALADAPGRRAASTSLTQARGGRGVDGVKNHACSLGDKQACILKTIASHCGLKSRVNPWFLKGVLMLKAVATRVRRGFWSVAGVSLFVLSVAAVQARQSPSTDAIASSITLAELPPQGRETYAQIRTGGPFAHAKDGTVFGNRERLLPANQRGYYREYTVRTPGLRDRGA